MRSTADPDPSLGIGDTQVPTVAPFNEPVGAVLVANDGVIQPDGKVLIAGHAVASGSCG